MYKMTTDEIKSKMLEIGVKKRFQYYQEAESWVILIRTKKPITLVDGEIDGCAISWQSDRRVFSVWTNKVKRVNAISEQYKIKRRHYNGEAELFVPPMLADEILPKFGARVKREMSQKQREAAKLGLAKARSFRFLPKKLPGEGGISDLESQDRGNTPPCPI